MGQAIYQLVAGYRKGDAISATARYMRDIFRSWGAKSDIYAVRKFAGNDCRGDLCELADLPGTAGPGDIAILHLSIGCEANRVFRSLRCKKVIVYHNITPAGYFEIVHPETARALDLGRRDLAALAGCAQLNLADSMYNAGELKAHGYGNVSVFPLPIDLALFPGSADAAALKRRQGPIDGHYNILFVGRFAPNKKIEDLVLALYYLSRIEPRARLVHVGSSFGMDAYYGLVASRVKTLGLGNVLFRGAVTQKELDEAYEKAHLFLCLSEHEGFCAPLVEAMLYKLPVLALGASAVPETLSGAGIVFPPPPDFPLVAETMAEVLHNAPLREAVVKRQSERIDAIRARDVSGELRGLLAPLMK